MDPKNSSGREDNVSCHTQFCELCLKSFKTEKGLKIHNTRIHHSSTIFSSHNASCNSEEMEIQETISLYNNLTKLKKSVCVMKRIPKSARICCAFALSKNINECIKSNSVESWGKLLSFSYKTFKIPHDGKGRKMSLSCLVKKNINDSDIDNAIIQTPPSSTKFPPSLAKTVMNKIADGDLSSAVRILSSRETIAGFDHPTFLKLKSKHPAGTPFRPLQNDVRKIQPLEVNKFDVLNAVRSFATSSAGGLDSLRPSHIQDMLSESSGCAREKLLISLAALCNFMLSGKVNPQISPILYGASLCALKKKDGGIRPIAVGMFYRRLVAKLACLHIRERLGEFFRPTQFGFGTPGGCEAVAHAARVYTGQHPNPTSRVFLKVDFKNAFNMVDRQFLLRKVNETIPNIALFLNQCYSSPSFLNFGEDTIMSEKGIQQGDPLGPALFCLAIHQITTSINCEFNSWYLDDGSIGGEADIVLDHLKVLKSQLKEIGIELNNEKCEIFFLDTFEQRVLDDFNSIIPGVKLITEVDLVLLGAPLTVKSLSFCIKDKTDALSIISSRLDEIPAHAAFFLLKNCLALPKMMYILRCSPTWHSDAELRKFDNLIHSTLNTLTNNQIKDQSWLQATLPVNMGGLGIRLATSLSLPAFLSSFHSVSNFVSLILPTAFSGKTDSFYEEGEKLWTSKVNTHLQAKDKGKQSAWDRPLLDVNLNNLLETAVSPFQKARLNAVSSKESGAWLNALPVASLGNLLDDESFRISVGLRLGSSICVPHRCKCGDQVTETGNHGLSCRLSAGRRSRHDAVNDLIKRALVSAKIPAILEPSGLIRDDGKRPDGMSLIPWKFGKPAVWDFTCVDTMAISHLKASSNRRGGAAENGEKNKSKKYQHLDNLYIFYPVAIETYGVFGAKAMEFIKDIGRKIFQVTSDSRSTAFLMQRISIAIQRGNAASILGTIPEDRQFDEFFNIPYTKKNIPAAKLLSNTHLFETNSLKKNCSIDLSINTLSISQNPSTFPKKLHQFSLSPAEVISGGLNSTLTRPLIDEGENNNKNHFPFDDDSGEGRSISTHNDTIRPYSQVKTLGINGLKNIGNTCFMNSVIQCLSNTRWLLEYLREDAYLKDINTSLIRKNGALIRTFSEVIKGLWSEDSSDQIVDTFSLKSQIQRLCPRFMGYDQQDVQEFLRYLLEGLHEDVNRVIENPKQIVSEIDNNLSDHEKALESWSRYSRINNSKIVDHFVGQLKSTLKCTYCGNCSVTFDTFWDLSFPIPHRTDKVRLSHCLDSFTREEILDGDEKPTCSKCKERRKCKKSFSIHKFPKLLVIHLKRFSTKESLRGKLNITMDFPIEGLDMTNYAADDNSPCQYNLYAISNHSGTLSNSGHYTAYCKHPYTGSWHKYNDSKVSSISPKSLVSSEAYVLFYEQEGSEFHF